MAVLAANGSGSQTAFAALSGIGAIAGALINYFRIGRRGAATLPAPAAGVQIARFQAVVQAGERYDQMCIRATRSVEASSAVTAAIAILAIQLVHKECPTDTTIGFSLAAAAFVASLVSSLLVLRTPMQVEERRRARSGANSSLAGLAGPVPLAAFQAVATARDLAWRAVVYRLGAIVMVAFMLLAALGFMAAGQYEIVPNTTTIVHTGRSHG